MYFSNSHKIFYALFTAILLLSSSVSSVYMSQNFSIDNLVSSSFNIKNIQQIKQNVTQQSDHCCLQCDNGCHDCSNCPCCHVLPRSSSNVFHLLYFPPLVIAMISDLLPIEYLQEPLVVAVIKSIYRPPIIE